MLKFIVPLFLALTPLSAQNINIAHSVNVELRRYWTSAPNGKLDPDLKTLACLYGSVRDSLIIVDSTAIQESCSGTDSTLIGALWATKFLPNPIPQALADSIGSAFCSKLNEFALNWHVMGVIYGIANSVPRVPEILACWRV